jgi:hypothetical protein
MQDRRQSRVYELFSIFDKIRINKAGLFLGILSGLKIGVFPTIWKKWNAPMLSAQRGIRLLDIEFFHFRYQCFIVDAQERGGFYLFAVGFL